jgi:hypothetical protein
MSQAMRVYPEVWPIAADEFGIWLISGAAGAWRPQLPVMADSEPHADVELELSARAVLDNVIPSIRPRGGHRQRAVRGRGDGSSRRARDRTASSVPGHTGRERPTGGAGRPLDRTRPAAVRTGSVDPARPGGRGPRNGGGDHRRAAVLRRSGARLRGSEADSVVGSRPQFGRWSRLSVCVCQSLLVERAGVDSRVGTAMQYARTAKRPCGLCASVRWSAAKSAEISEDCPTAAENPR